jgi:hypothetical protein
VTDARGPGCLALTVTGAVAAAVGGLVVAVLTASSGPGLDWRQGITHPGHLRLGLIAGGAALCWILCVAGLGLVVRLAKECQDDVRHGRLVIGFGRWRRPATPGTKIELVLTAWLALFVAIPLIGALRLTDGLLQLVEDETWRRRTPPYGTTGPLLAVMLAVGAAAFGLLASWFAVLGSRPVDGDQQER